MAIHVANIYMNSKMSHVTLHTTIVNYLGVEVNTLFEHLIEKITVNRSDIVIR